MRINVLGWGNSLGDRLHSPTYLTLSPDLYFGTAGICWFLGALYYQTGDKKILRTLNGAVNQTISKFRGDASCRVQGLYHGGLGISYVMSKLADLTSSSDLLQMAEELSLESLETKVTDLKSDLVSGLAGSIICLLAFKKIFGKTFYHDRAMAMGHELIRMAQPYKDAFAWRTSNKKSEFDLTGFSHGAAGIGYALSELFAVSSDPAFKEMAEKAFQYEQYWFDPVTLNWAGPQGKITYGFQRKKCIAFLLLLVLWSCRHIPFSTAGL